MRTKEEINEYLLRAISGHKALYSQAKQDYMNRYNIHGVYASDIVPISGGEKWDMEDNLRNILSIASNNMVAALFCEYEVINLRQKLKRKQKELDRENHLKHLALLFMLKTGYFNEFRNFVNSYSGDLEPDLQKEVKNHIICIK